MGNQSLLSPAYIAQAREDCRSWETHWVRFARSLASAKAGSSKAARMAMMAITTSNSMSVKARSCGDRLNLFFFIIKRIYSKLGGGSTSRRTRRHGFQFLDQVSKCLLLLHGKFRVVRQPAENGNGIGVNP